MTILALQFRSEHKGAAYCAELLSSKFFAIYFPAHGTIFRILSAASKPA